MEKESAMPDERIDQLVSDVAAVKKTLESSKAPTSRLLYLVEKLVLPVMLGVLAYFASSAANKIADGQLALAREEASRRDAQFEATTQATYLELFYSDISSRDRPRQESALRLLRLMKPALADAMATLAESTPDLAPEARVVARAISQTSRALGDARYKIGIYFLPDKPALQRLAARIERELQSRGFGGRIEIYRKDGSFFPPLGMPSGLEIRYEEPAERLQAEELSRALSSILPGQVFRLRPVRNRTQDFISLFLADG